MIGRKPIAYGSLDHTTFISHVTVVKDGCPDKLKFTEVYKYVKEMNDLSDNFYLAEVHEEKSVKPERLGGRKIRDYVN